MVDDPARDEFTASTGGWSGETIDAQLARPERPRPRRSFTGWLLIVFMIAIVVGPLVHFWLPGEIARWQLAMHIEQQRNGDLAGALANLDRTIEQYPDEPALYLQRAAWYQELGDHERALQDCDRAIELSPASVAAYLQRCEALWYLGRFDEAVKDMERVRKSFEGSRLRSPEALNGLAYARALAKSDLDKAAEEIEAAMAAVPENAAMLDTRGYIRYLQKEYEAAREDLDNAVALAEQGYASHIRRLQGRELGVLDPRDSRLLLKQLKRTVAVIRYHRALVYKALGRQEYAQRDLQRVRELGHEPGDQLF